MPSPVSVPLVLNMSGDSPMLLPIVRHSVSVRFSPIVATPPPVMVIGS